MRLLKKEDSMAKAKKLPSGNYRVQYLIDGKRYSFTAETAALAEYAALQHKLERKRAKSSTTKTLGAAIDDYIDLKSNILSPSTIAGYRQIQRNAFPLLIDLPLSKITEKLIQKQINDSAGRLSAKTVRNHYGLLIAVLKNEGMMTPNIALKPKEKIQYNIPSPEDIPKIMEAVRDKGQLEIFILMVLTMGLRPSEAVAVKWDNYDGEKMLIKGSKVKDADRNYIYKERNKTYHSTRLLDVPEILRSKLDNMDRQSEFILTKTQTAFYNAFQLVLSKNGLPHYRVYDLRHAYASVMLSLGVPDKYAMERMGHSTPNMLKTVYQHTFKNKQDDISKQINSFFDEKAGK